MLRKIELFTFGGSLLFVALLTSFAPAGKSSANPLFATERSLFSAPNASPTFKWSMPKRFGPKNDDGIVDYHWNRVTQTYDPAYVNPGSWTVDFDACDPAAAAGSTYQWEIDGVVQTNPTPNACKFTHPFTEQKTYPVKLTVTSPAGELNVAEAPVTVRDLLIVSIGDSFASGQGNPDIPKKGSVAAKWVDQICSRSAIAGPAQAALSIEQADPHTSVTFISYACSGATINQGLIGIFPKGPANLPPQVDQVKQSVAGRHVDALLISIGGNDMGFANLLARCIFKHNCHEDDDSKTILRNGLDSLPTAYQQLNDRIKGLEGVTITKVFITEYPDLVHNEIGELCDRKPIFDLLIGIDKDEAQWASTEAIGGLNAEVKKAADQFGWVYVGGVAAGFLDHGYCAKEPQRWVRTFTEARHEQGGDARCNPESLRSVNGIKDCIISSGSVHPSGGGHAWYSTRIIEEMKKAGVVPPVAP